jgi:hypothetical protein
MNGSGKELLAGEIEAYWEGEEEEEKREEGAKGFGVKETWGRDFEFVSLSVFARCCSISLPDISFRLLAGITSSCKGTISDVRLA